MSLFFGLFSLRFLSSSTFSQKSVEFVVVVEEGEVGEEEEEEAEEEESKVG